MTKLSHLVDGVWQAHSYPALYELDDASGSPRLLAGVPDGKPEPFERLAACLKPPYFLLYVLHTPRGEGEPGRYQSPEMSAADFHAFLARFGAYLANDGRFDIWLHSPAENATIVWDRHNRLFAYGPLDRFAAALRTVGFAERSCDVLGPHQHHYRAEYDADAAALLAWHDWRYSPLHPEDEQ
jgi:hypothetical protein